MEFDQVEYTYPCTSQPALHQFSLQLPAARRCALIGRNGCGKTTLFRLANGLFRPQKGTVLWQGKPFRYDRTSLNHLRQQVGLVFQDPEQQLVATTVEEDISYGLCNLELPESEIATRVSQALHRFELLELADQPVNYLSLGQKKRLAIADVMVLQPKLLLLDEPTAYLDPYQCRSLLRILEMVETSGITTVIATHNLDFACAWAEWIVVMDQGQVVLEGTPADVFARRQLMTDLGLGVPLVMDTLDIVDEVLLNTWGSSAPNPSAMLRQRIQERLQTRLKW
jgi:cobalt/nickel transport system ATP-binding protein